MSEVKLKSEKYDISRTVAMKFGRTVIDESLIVPDVKPDIKKILDVSARTYVTDVTPGQDKVVVEGMVKAAVLYLPDGDVIGKVKSLDMSREFSAAIDAKNAAADNQVTAEAEIDSLDSALINSRKVNIRVGINVGVKICKSETVEFPVGIDCGGEELPAQAPPFADLLPFKSRQTEEKTANEAQNNIQLKKTPLRLADKQFSSDGSIIVRGQHEISSKLPRIGEVLCATASVEPDDASMEDGSVKLSGNVKVSVLYEEESEDGREGGMRSAEFSLPYSEQFEAPKAVEDMECDVEYNVREIYTEVMDNMDGEPRIIGIETVIGVNVCGYLISEPGVVCDGYCTDGSTLTPEFAETSPEQLVDFMSAQISQKCSVKRKPTDAPISGVCAINVLKTSVDDIDIKDGTVFIKGTVTIKVLCASSDENQPLYPIETTTPFEHSFDISGPLGSKAACDAKIFVNHIGYNISGSDTVDIRMLIGISVKLIKNDRVKTVTSFDIIESEETSDNGMQSYIIYFVQPGDTLWNIAKRYKTTVDDIVAGNGITNPDKLSIGQKIRLKA